MSATATLGTVDERPLEHISQQPSNEDITHMLHASSDPYTNSLGAVLLKKDFSLYNCVIALLLSEK